jgi:hypothetical protein
MGREGVVSISIVRVFFIFVSFVFQIGRVQEFVVPACLYASASFWDLSNSVRGTFRQCVLLSCDRCRLCEAVAAMKQYITKKYSVASAKQSVAFKKTLWYVLSVK